jgi:hypothetical protein
MSFGAMAAWQAWLILVGAGALALWLFRLKVRPPRVHVPSLLLWRRVFDQARELSWWERIRRAVSLVATVLLAVALALAVTRPGPGRVGTSRGRVVIVLDSSWSMLAETSSGERRWDRAVAEARRLAVSAGGEEVALATTADGLVEGPTTDLALIETAIDQLAPSGGADAAWPDVGGAERVHFLTDGAIGRPVDSAVVVHSVFEPAPNVAITAFEVRPPSAAPDGPAAAYLEVANYADDPQTVQLTVSRGTTVITDTSIDMAAGEAVRQTLPLGAGDARLRARVSAPSNALAIDDEATAWLASAEPMAVTVVSTDPGPLGLLLGRDPGLRVRVQAPAAYDPVGADVLVFDRWVPPAAPGRPALFLNPPDSDWLGSRGVIERQARWSSAASHPVLAGVDPTTLDIALVAGFEGASLLPVAETETGTPLVLVADDVDRRFVVVNISVTDSNLAFAPAFPVLTGNALEWLARPVLDTIVEPGRLALPASTSRVTAPDGARVALRAVASGQMVVLPEPGLYLVETGGARSVVGVNVGSPGVSNLASTMLSGADQELVAPSGDAGRAWWLYAVGLAFVLAAAEWWTWQRRITV